MVYVSKYNVIFDFGFWIFDWVVIRNLCNPLINRIKL